MKYCSACAHPVELKIPDGDHLPRHVCPACGTIHYRNPKVIVGVIPEWEDKILLCKRAIEPRRGLWTFPAGFLELDETTAQGAGREAQEEARADVEVQELFVVISVPYVSQLYLIHRGRMRSPLHAPTLESSETVLVREDQIPWPQIAFPTIGHSLKFFCADRAAGTRVFHALDLTARPSRPQDREIANSPL